MDTFVGHFVRYYVFVLSTWELGIHQLLMLGDLIHQGVLATLGDTGDDELSECEEAIDPTELFPSLANPQQGALTQMTIDALEVVHHYGTGCVRTSVYSTTR